jgi:hypothetical protein
VKGGAGDHSVEKSISNKCIDNRYCQWIGEDKADEGFRFWKWV